MKQILLMIAVVALVGWGESKLDARAKAEAAETEAAGSRAKALAIIAVNPYIRSY